MVPQRHQKRRWRCPRCQCGGYTLKYARKIGHTCGAPDQIARMLAMRAEGKNLHEVGQAFGIGRDCVRRILRFRNRYRERVTTADGADGGVIRPERPRKQAPSALGDRELFRWALAQTVREWRHATICSQEELGRQLGANRTWVDALERRYSAASLDVLYRLAPVMGLTLTELTRRVEDCFSQLKSRQRRSGEKAEVEREGSD